MPFHIGDKAPNLTASDCVREKPTNLDSETGNTSIFERAKRYLDSKQFSAKTFEEYSLLLVENNGVCTTHFFGSNGFLDSAIKQLLNE